MAGSPGHTVNLTVFADDPLTTTTEQMAALPVVAIVVDSAVTVL